MQYIGHKFFWTYNPAVSSQYPELMFFELHQKLFAYANDENIVNKDSPLNSDLKQLWLRDPQVFVRSIRPENYFYDVVFQRSL